MVSSVDSMQGVDDDNNDAVGRAEPDAPQFRLRAYQTEMLEESLKANIIVVQDTGSGKTHIALARTAVELETCPVDKLVWFLAPTVTLCEQQLKVFQQNLAGYGIQMLSGQDDVDHWTDQATWDAVLRNVRIVVSTHQVLLDALTHGFIRMKRLALLIFDEAHHCTGSHPANLILANFYLPIDKNDPQLPRILGLSASPVMKATASKLALEVIEKNMSAITKTPKVHRSEMLQYVHRPTLHRIDYPPTTTHDSPLYKALQSEISNYDISQDPYVVDLKCRLVRYKQDPNMLQGTYLRDHKRLQEACLKELTYCLTELRTLARKCEDTATELGTSVSDWYLQQTITRFRKETKSSESLLELGHKEKLHLLKILNRLPLPEDVSSQPLDLEGVSPKVKSLINILGSQANPDLRGLIFVEQKVWVAALAEIITFHPLVQGKISLGTFIGTSTIAKRTKNVASLIEPRNQKDTLGEFRRGATNIIITTSVLEEGIDVPECHFVVCFESPKNLKSFIQRRGRARRQESKYFIFSPLVGNVRSPAQWELLEEEMRIAYEDDMRRLIELQELESVEECGQRLYEVESTKALLTLDNASQHLYHFCAVLNSGPYVDTRPQFDFVKENGNIRAEVMLPLSVDPSLRKAHGIEWWKTERMAMKDAAFESYKLLHKHKLVNDNLLPAKQEDDSAAGFRISDRTPSMMTIASTPDTWLAVAQCQQQNPQSYHRMLLEFRGILPEPFYLVLHLPVPLPAVPEIELYWNRSKNVSVKTHWLPGVTLSSEKLEVMGDVTRKILKSMHGSRMQDARQDLLWLITPADKDDFTWSHEKLLRWHEETSGHKTASEVIREGRNMASWGVVTTDNYKKWFAKQVVTDPSGNASLAIVHASRVPKRRDFLHRIPVNDKQKDAYTRTEQLLPSQCIVENLPSSFSVCALLLPCVMFQYETYLTTDALRLGLLAPLAFKPEDLPLLVQAVTASSMNPTLNYQRLEFFGDCVLKFIATVHVMADHPQKPESFLTPKKGQIVSNGFAARATLAAGLDKFIFRKAFTGAKWAVPYANDILSATTAAEETISSKTLADIVESLIGASYLIGGFPKAFTCIQTLMPTENWTPIPKANSILHDAVPTEVTITPLATVEALIGYTFNKKMALLEALTHGSYRGTLVNCSYERLEFLGDAVLDFIISQRLYAHTPELGHEKMHTIRTAMANATFLTIRMLETTIAEKRTLPPDMRTVTEHRCLWQFLRSSGDFEFLASRDAALRRYEAVRDAINEAIRSETRFPWHLFALLDAPKFLSDIVESVIGAIYVDSGGNLDACEVFVRRLGILDCLDRIIHDGVDCLHPKERIGHLAVEKKVRYVTVNGAGGNADGAYRTQVVVGEEAVGGVVSGLKRLHAETIAAWEASKILEERNRTNGSEDGVMGQGVFGGDAAGDEDGDEVWFEADDGGGYELV